jgi:prepilin-type N-terminal cleavage/methylation domain-containing protein
MLSSKFQVPSSKFSQGFTLIELLVALVILVLFSAWLFIGGSSSDEFKLKGEAQTLVANIRLVQEKALSSDSFQGSAPEGWGVEFNESQPDRYFIFADLAPGNNQRDPGELFQEVMLDDKVTLQNLNASQAAVVYKPPRPEVTITPGSISKIEATLGLIDNPSKSRKITIELTGRVNIE